MERIPYRPISVFDVTVLLVNLLNAKANKEVGVEDASKTFEELVKELNVSVKLRESTLESALWCANMLEERGEFTHPLAISFKDFAKRIAGRDVFDPDYNYFRDPKPRG